jgi:hypothetical protein
VEPDVAAGAEEAELELLSPPAGFAAGLASAFVSEELDSDEDALLFDA